ncbi:hypothetical protein GCM10027072_52290 [Streptomyces bullii]
MRAFSQPSWDSPLAAMEQNRAKESSLSRISGNRPLAESIVGTSLPGSAKNESNAAQGVLQQVCAATPPNGGPPVYGGARRARNRAARGALFRVTAVAGKTPEPPPRP